VNFECRLTQLIQLQRLDESPLETWLILGEVVTVHIDRAYLKDGVYDTAAAHPILRAGRMGDYAEITPEAIFEMPRPPWPLS
jgi:flavin reductase (DIM6/NTAB) family NADH-FMN oxidoreductase RutF